MRPMIAILSLVVTLTVGAQAQTPAPPQKITLLSSMLRMQQGAERDVLEAAELMPEEHYSFRSTPETKPFGQIVAHIALSRIAGCVNRLGKENPHRGEREDTPRTKAQLVGLLKEANTLCAAAREGLTDASVSEMVKLGTSQTEVSRGGWLVTDAVHAYEVYGTMAVYLRLKGIVPPTTARTNKARAESR